MKGYFTVEAACVLPMILGIYVFLIYAMFYQYDRCLAEQEAVVAAMEEKFEAASGEQGYLAWQTDAKNITIEKGRTKVLIEGSVAVPFAALRQWITGEGWKVKAVFDTNRAEPTTWIRNIKKIMEAGETDD